MLEKAFTKFVSLINKNKGWEPYREAKKLQRQTEIEETILSIAADQKTILAELAWVRKKLTYIAFR